MGKMPISVKNHISNANYYLEAAGLIPYTFDAVRILLLLTAWENIQIAEEELSAWAQQNLPAKELRKSHAYKFRSVRKSKSIERIVVGLRDTPPKTTIYSTGDDFAQLLEICRYGLGAESKDLKTTFEKGWFYDAFGNALVSKIKWEEAAVKMYEDLLKSGKLDDPAF